MLIYEYRIVLPMTTNEYQIAQLFNVARTSTEHTTSEEGIEIVKNEPFEGKPIFENQFDSGQYTYKIYHMQKKIPYFVRVCLSSEAMSVHEEAYNAFPYCRTILTNPSLGSRFNITIETMHLNDNGCTENAHQLPPELLQQRKVIYIDIANDRKPPVNGLDPSTYKSDKTGRGPLGPTWQSTATPLMTCYKLVKAEFRLFGVQSRVEEWIQAAEQKLFLDFHRQLFCTTDEWYGMTMEEIRRMEEEVREKMLNTLASRSLVSS